MFELPPVPLAETLARRMARSAGLDPDQLVTRYDPQRSEFGCFLSYGLAQPAWKLFWQHAIDVLRELAAGPTDLMCTAVGKEAEDAEPGVTFNYHHKHKTAFAAELEKALRL